MTRIIQGSIPLVLAQDAIAALVSIDGHLSACTTDRADVNCGDAGRIANARTELARGDDDAAAVITAIAGEMAFDPALVSVVQAAHDRVWRLKAGLGLIPDVDPADYPLCGS